MNIQYSIDWERGIDPYRQDTGGQTEPAMYLIIGDDDIHVVVEQSNPGQTGIGAIELLYVNVALPPTQDEYDQTPDEKAFDEYIHSPEAQALLVRIAEGYDTKWSGRHPGEGNLQAVLDDNATEALDKLEAGIEDLPVSTIVWWNVEDWFGQADWGMGGDEVDDWIAHPTGDDQDVRLTDDPTEHILENVAWDLRDELYGTHAPANLITVGDMLVVVNRDEDGDIEEVQAITTPAGHHWERDCPNPPILTIQAPAHGFNVSTRRARALAENRHKRFGIGRKLPSGQWVFLPGDLGLLRPRS